jgi:ERCC4-related helicase
LENWLEVEFILLKHLKLQPNVLDGMEFYRVEYMLHFFKEYSEKEKNAQEKNNGSPSSTSMVKEAQRNQANMMKSMKSPAMPKMNNLPSKFPGM